MAYERFLCRRFPARGLTDVRDLRLFARRSVFRVRNGVFARRAKTSALLIDRAEFVGEESEGVS